MSVRIHPEPNVGFQTNSVESSSIVTYREPQRHGGRSWNCYPIARRNVDVQRRKYKVVKSVIKDMGRSFVHHPHSYLGFSVLNCFSNRCAPSHNRIK